MTRRNPASMEDLKETLLVAADAAEEVGLGGLAGELREIAKRPRAAEVPPLMCEQFADLRVRARKSVLDEALRDRVLRDTYAMLGEVYGLGDDYMIDPDALINQNDDGDFWVTCRLWVRGYHDDDDR